MTRNAAWLALSVSAFGACASLPSRTPAYQELRSRFAKPDHFHWGEVPLWWWEGERLSRDRVTWQLETLAAQGVKAVCPIQRSPGRCDPSSFSDAWWRMFEFVHAECKRLGMALWAYDQVGYGHYGWLEKAAAKADDPRTRRIRFLSADGGPAKPLRLEIPEGELIAARAYPLADGRADDGRSLDVAQAVRGRVLEWRAPRGRWRVAAAVAVPYRSFRLSEAATDAFLDALYGEFQRRLGSDALGKSFLGVFQDEHAPTPRDIYTEDLARRFRDRFGYPIGRAIPALHFDVGPRTPRYRIDFFDAYLALDESLYWKKVYDWTAARGLLTSHDNWGRQNIDRQSQGYIDYFRTQRWFSAPGYDDYGRRSLAERNYYDTKIAASIARLYGRPRVWSEAFHSSGWGRTTDQTLTWLSANFAFGANLYDEHGLYYSTRASTWEHAAPDPHWRQPYWRYYGQLSDWVARISYLMSQGVHVVDAAVHYPVVSVLAGQAPGVQGPDHDTYMRVSRTIYDAGIDNDIIDDDSIARGTVAGGKLHVGGNGYGAFVFGPETTIRRSVVEKALALAHSGGTVLFFGRLPTASAERGRADPKLAALLRRILGFAGETTREEISKSFAGGGFAAFLPTDIGRLPTLVAEHVDRDFAVDAGTVFVQHRRIGPAHVYLIQNTTDSPLDLRARCLVDGVPEIWDAFTGEVKPVDRFERRRGATRIAQRLEGNTATLVVFRPGRALRGGRAETRAALPARVLPDKWTFSVEPTRDNRWGEFRWPPSQEVIGPEVRQFRYAEETAESGVDLSWNSAAFDDEAWPVETAGIGPYWLRLGPLPRDFDAATILPRLDHLEAGRGVSVGHERRTWRTVEFSQTIGLAKSAPWSGHSGYPDGAIDRNFIDLPAGRKLLFTRLHSPHPRRLGLRVELRNATPRLFVNGVEQPFEGAVGNLPLRGGENTVLLDLPDGGSGRLFVQKEAPSVSSLSDAAEGVLTPDLSHASWIWGGPAPATYLRKAFRLERVPEAARITITAYTGYRLFVGGVKVAEEIGPWADWKKPETLNIARHLRRGENVIAIWAHVDPDLGSVDSRGVSLACTLRHAGGKERQLVSDDSFRGSTAEHDGWTRAGFDDSAWRPADVLGRMGAKPWGRAPLDNLATVTEPRRRRAIDLASPYLECFAEVPDIAYDVKPRASRRIGWFRFEAPPGLRRLRLGTDAKAQVWVDGAPARVEDGRVRIAEPPAGTSTVAIRLEMKRGSYGGAAFSRPIGLELGGGTIGLGPWAKFGLPTYAGIGVYRQEVLLSADEAARRTALDLGHVLVAAEVRVNGAPAGVRLARPFKFDLRGLLREGRNTFEVRVANTLAPHYTVTRNAHNLGPTTSGLVGPVVMR